MKKYPAAARVAVGVGIPAVIAAGVLLFIKAGSPPWFIHAMTGLYCPGCGAGRAIDALMHLRILDALQYNLLFTLALPVGILFLLKWYISVVGGREIMKRVRITDRGAWICLAVILSFLVLRNIPAAPFKYLSPNDFL